MCTGIHGHIEGLKIFQVVMRFEICIKTSNHDNTYGVDSHNTHINTIKFFLSNC